MGCQIFLCHSEMLLRVTLDVYQTVLINMLLSRKGKLCTESVHHGWMMSTLMQELRDANLKDSINGLDHLLINVL